ncbi:DUF938 domain-containing protein [uncultured Roseobacter sp.]|uniref:DUF938 domain-containing protein n=1 Tax=uncultured Roseobacter sp. TaxID=114847 RepID=UPI00263043A6|nr:DUF938 domain-containing protein [uncultured Roseobacter sp.]
MTSKLPPNASVAARLEGAKLHAPAAARNLEFLCDLLRAHAPKSGQALEIASGTGQHVTDFATAMPGLMWHPTEVDAARISSIDAYVQDAGLGNVAPARMLDATQADWHRHAGQKDLIVLINLLHLIPEQPAKTLVTEAMRALSPGGSFILYGPFKRNGVLTSDGDARFDADLRAADPAIGYKNDQDLCAWLELAGAHPLKRIEMPANNLAFVATKPEP